MERPLLNKSLEFATQIVLFYEEYAKSKRDTTIFFINFYFILPNELNK